MTSNSICECGMDLEALIKWHGTTEWHFWNKLKKGSDGIQEDARCDLCDEQAHLKKLRVNGKRVPDWWIVAIKETLTVRCKYTEDIYLSVKKLK